MTARIPAGSHQQAGCIAPLNFEPRVCGRIAGGGRLAGHRFTYAKGGASYDTTAEKARHHDGSKPHCVLHLEAVGRAAGRYAPDRERKQYNVGGERQSPAPETP